MNQITPTKWGEFPDTIKQLSRSTGFPPQAIVDFADRGLLPGVDHTDDAQKVFDGLSLLRYLEGINNG
ncbi:MAG: hypothetical protein HYX72_00430 [Acidobacteria bacterium]|nr:hypothetical protein [Acidobacteriota bacterium]